MSKVMAMMRRGFTIKLILLVALVAFGDWLFWQRNYGIGNLGIYGLVLMSALIIVRPATIKTLPGIIATLATALYCSAIIFDISFLSFTMFWTALCVAALMPFASRLKDGWEWFWRLALHGVASFLNPFFDVGKLNRVSKKRPTRKFGARAALSLLGLPLVGGAIFLALFVQANPVLEDIVAKWKLPALDEVLVFRIIIWVVAAFLIWSVLRPLRMKGGMSSNIAPSLPAASTAIFTLASIQLSLWVFNGLFLMQNGMDLAFLTGLVPLPEKMTLAQYAHRGAYPLIGTAILAGLFVLAILKPGTLAASDKSVRLLVVVWIAQNVVLVASSMVRTWDYVEAYSLTQLRISALAWMVLVGLGLALICWRMLRGKSGSWLLNANLLLTGLMLSAFCFIDMRAMAAQWNVIHAKEVGGRGAQLDLCYMGEMGPGAIAPLMSLEARPLPEDFRKRVQSVRLQVQRDAQHVIDTGGWTHQLETRLAAAKALEPSLPKLDLGSGYRDCSGRVIDPIATYAPEAPRAPELTAPVTP
jgi:Domain of unknown function (DUF4173)